MQGKQRLDAHQEEADRCDHIQRQALVSRTLENDLNANSSTHVPGNPSVNRIILISLVIALKAMLLPP